MSWLHEKLMSESWRDVVEIMTSRYKSHAFMPTLYYTNRGALKMNITVLKDGDQRVVASACLLPTWNDEEQKVLDPLADMEIDVSMLPEPQRDYVAMIRFDKLKMRW